MSTPVWKVYDAEGKYRAACDEPEAAACLVCSLYSGGTVRYNHNLIVWREPADSTSAASAAVSYDEAAEAMLRARARLAAARSGDRR